MSVTKVHMDRMKTFHWEIFAIFTYKAAVPSEQSQAETVTAAEIRPLIGQG